MLSNSPYVCPNLKGLGVKLLLTTVDEVGDPPLQQDRAEQCPSACSEDNISEHPAPLLWASLGLQASTLWKTVWLMRAPTVYCPLRSLGSEAREDVIAFWGWTAGEGNS